MQSTTKLTFILKMILGMMFAIEAGRMIAFNAEYSSPILGSWLPAFIYTFYPLVCIVIMQWVLFSEYLPDRWVFLGFLGSITAGIVIGTAYLFITDEIYNTYDFEIGLFRALVSGILIAFPQLFLLRGKKGNLWMLANSIGLTVHFVGQVILFIPPVHDSLILAFLRMLLLESPSIFVGLMLGLYLYTYIYKPTLLQTDDKNN